jgi:hypothetical protein
MKRIILAFAIAASIVAATPVILPDQATQASAVVVQQTRNYLWVATWMWVSYPGQNPSGEWVLINLEPNVGQ